MRAFGTVVAAVLGAAVLAGCGPSDSATPDAAPPRPSSTQPATTSTTSTTTTSPAPADSLLRLTRTGGFAGRTHTLQVQQDGSWTLLDADARPERTGRLTEPELAALRTALREADFARLPRTTTGGPTIYDGFAYTFVHAGHEVASDDGSLPPALAKVLAALPPLTA
ncbi:hypothetical protein [Streptomyces sp. NPDC047014]|uniref:hypothetical protein n=1 Tax=Streptomyces sp. NPDC047014 TaxID=3155736 RepID=UPI0033FB6E9F